MKSKIRLLLICLLAMLSSFDPPVKKNISITSRNALYTLPCNGQLSIGDINVETGNARTASNSSLRTLGNAAGKPAGQIAISDFFCYTKQILVNYHYSQSANPSYNSFAIYRDGTLMAQSSVTTSGSFAINVGQRLKVTVSQTGLSENQTINHINVSGGITYDISRINLGASTGDLTLNTAATVNVLGESYYQ